MNFTEFSEFSEILQNPKNGMVITGTACLDNNSKNIFFTTSG